LTVKTHRADIELGPTIQALVEIMDVLEDALELVPEWQQREAEELRERALAVLEAMGSVPIVPLDPPLPPTPRGFG
jgi:hypothetical protein